VVGISMGDPSGIGPEIVAAALGRPRVRAALIPVVFGDEGSLASFPIFRRFDRLTERLRRPVSGPTLCAVSQLSPRDRRPGRPNMAGGVAQLSYVKAAIAAARAGDIDALCTAPVSKEQITRTGVPFVGHTELLASAFGCEVLMMMDGPRIRVALATSHLPIAKVPRALRIPRLVRQLELLAASLAPLLRRRPKIVVCGLNPHAGEGGTLGMEEREIIRPAIVRARARGVDCQGPFAADGLFALKGPISWDVALAMFHDQGLVASKALDFERTVNVTLGLPLPRTSPDHGVAYSLAGKSRASAEPMVQALLKAAAFSRGWAAPASSRRKPRTPGR
jgi:4-hydroxythreonine-4-phosphate dehydrogenase